MNLGTWLGQFNRKLNFRLREVNIAQFKMTLSLMRIAFPVSVAYTVTDEHLLIHYHETQTHDPKAISSYPASCRQAWGST